MPEAAIARPEISIVVPLYCEAGTLVEFLESLEKALAGLEATSEVILIDDGSTDGTWELLGRLTRGRPGFHRLRLSRNFGKEKALCAGLDVASGQAIVTLDGDMQHPPDLIPEMVEIWRRGEALVVEGTRAGRRTQIAPRVFYKLFHVLARVDLRGATDFKLLDKSVLSSWRSMKERGVFYRGMIWWLGYPAKKVFFEVPVRSSGATGWSLSGLVRLAVTAISSFSSAPLHLATGVGGAFMLFALVLGAQTLYTKFSGQAVDGFATVILLILLTSSLGLLSLGVIGHYLARIYDELKQRPRYIVGEKIWAAEPYEQPERPD